MVIITPQITTVSNDLNKVQIKFKGFWLEELGFSHETIVVASFNNGILTLQAHGIGLETYQSLVKDVRKNKQHLCQVLSHQKHYEKEPHLVIEGLWLTRHGFNINDIVFYQSHYRCIKIKKLDLSLLGFNTTENAHYKALLVQKSGKTPQLQVKGDWLNDIGFQSGYSALVTYETNSIILTAHKNKIGRTTTKGIPPYINIGKNLSSPNIRLTGTWLLDFGYNIGDIFIIQIKQDFIRFKRLENKYLTFDNK